MEDLKKRIRHVPDFPKPGILFYDVTTLLKDATGFKMAIDEMTRPHLAKAVDVVVGIESRGFIFGAAIADRLNAGFSPVRKPGKLPHKTQRASYALEYGTDALEMHEDAIVKGSRVVIVDDVPATGGTARAVASLVRRAGGNPVGALFLIELGFLGGAAKLGDLPVRALLRY
jgi:adenine phosphoribosyltransferase